MGLTSEQVHWAVGAGVVVFATVLMLYETGVWRASALRYAVAAALFAFGLEGVFDPLIHGAAAPRGYAAEMAQHFVQAVVLLALGTVEILRVRGRLTARGWGMPFPIGLFGLGLLFVFHAQHQAGGPPLLLATQHRILGVTLLAAAIFKALAELGLAKTRSLVVGWLIPVLLVGFELLLYTEGGPASAHLGH